MSSSTPANLNKITKRELMEMLRNKDAELAEISEALKQCRNELKNVDSEADLVTNLEEKSKKLQAQVEEDRKELQELQEERTRLRQELEETRQKLEPRESSAEASKGQDTHLASPKSTFRLELYDREGQVQGKIVHLLSKESVNFREVDTARIAGFIREHMPVSGSKAASPVPTKEQIVSPAQSKPLPVQPDDDTQSRVQPQTNEELAVEEATSGSTIIFARTGEAVHIHLDNLLRNATEDLSFPLFYHAKIYARSLSGRHYDLASSEGVLETNEPVDLLFRPNMLDLGIYNLEVIVNFKDENGRPAPVALFEEKGRLLVL